MTPTGIFHISWLFLLFSNGLVYSLPQKIQVGLLYDTDDILKTAFVSAVNRVNAEREVLPKYHLDTLFEPIAPHDSLEAYRHVCRMVQRGVAAIFGPQSPDTAAHVQSICDVLEIPHIETRWDFRSRREVYSINLYPHPSSLSLAYQDYVEHYGWERYAILYETNEGLIRLQELLSYRSGMAKPMTVRQLSKNRRYWDVLRYLKMKNETNIIIDCETKTVTEVLKQALQVGMISSEHHYLITSLDLDTLNLEDFRYGGANITAFQMFSQTDEKVKQVVNDWIIAERRIQRIGDPDSLVLDTETALMFDAVHLYAKALHELDSSQKIDIRNLSCEDEKPWSHGNSLINYMKLAEYEGLSGIIRFDPHGFRTEFDLNVVRVQYPSQDSQYSPVLVKTGVWSSRFKEKNVKRLNITELPRPPKPKMKFSTSLDGVHLIVSTILSDPFMMLKDSYKPLKGNDQYEGFCVDIIQVLSEKLGFTYEIMLVPDKNYGSRIGIDKDGRQKWDGMVGEVYDGRADIVIADLSMNADRESVLDFTTPFMNLGISIMYVKPQKDPPGLLSFLSPFESDVWVYMMATYLGVSVVLFVLARLSPEEWTNPNPCIQDPDSLQNDFTLANSLWFTIGSLMQQGSDIAPKAGSTRVVASIWWFFTLIMISTYTANLAAFLTIEVTTSPFESASGMVNQTRAKFGTQRYGSTRRFFKESTMYPYTELNKMIESFGDDALVDNNKKGMQKVIEEKGGYAFFIESPANKFFIERNCELRQVGDLLDSKGYGIGMRKDSPYRNHITRGVLELQEKGKLRELDEKWWKKERGGGKCVAASSGSATPSPLDLANVGGIFAVLVGGIISATCIAFCEFVWKTKKIDRSQRGSVCYEMLKEMSFAMKCEDTKKLPKKRYGEPENGMAVPLSTYGVTSTEQEIFT